MSSPSSNLSLPYLEPAQAQKHVTVNEALRRLDALVQLSVVSAAVTAQPAAPVDGSLYILPAGKTGAAWGPMANAALAYWCDGAWEQISPREGWTAWVRDSDQMLVFNGAAWTPPLAAIGAVARAGDTMGGNLAFSGNLQGAVLSSGGRINDRASPESTLIWGAGNTITFLSEDGNTQLGRINASGFTFGNLNTPLFHGSAHSVPILDNTYDLGAASFRMRTIYAGTGTINTSDAREKTPLEPVPAGVKRAVRRIIAGVGVFQYRDAVDAKGADAARLHVGVTAQAVRDAFAAEGEDAARWALFCADPVLEHAKVEDDAGGQRLEARPALDAEGRPRVRLGLRHDQLALLALAALMA